MAARVILLIGLRQTTLHGRVLRGSGSDSRRNEQSDYPSAG
jgi:hypothetical protein